MTDPLPSPSPFDMSMNPADDGSFTIPKLKAASESLRLFNDALLRIGEAESDEQTDPVPRVSPSIRIAQA